jgi:hypothetical protein
MAFMAELRNAMVLSALAALALTLSLATPVSAECPSVYEWPSFGKAAPKANRIVMGRVIKIVDSRPGWSSLEFRLRVTEVLRGSAPGTLDLSAQADRGDCIPSHLDVIVGDELAIAFGPETAADGVPGPVSAVVFLNRTPDLEMHGIQRMTRAEVRALAALPPTDATPRAASSTSSSPSVLLVLMALAGATAGFHRFGPGRRRASPGTTHPQGLLARIQG